MTVDVNKFTKEIVYIFKGERYSVRDNGAVFRHQREGKRTRVDDNQWTFGKVNPRNGYLHIASDRVHRIVATAFHGEPSDPQHIVDHIDTNRQNNRPENLRWLSRLENALKNPITQKKIVNQCGSIDAFLENPSILNDLSGDPTISWMRTVTKEEAKNCKERMHIWAITVNEPAKSKRSFKSNRSFNESIYKPLPGPESFKDWVYAFTVWMKKRLKGRGITLVGYVTSKSGKSIFRCSNGHEWRTRSIEVGEKGEGCPHCGIGYCTPEEIWQTAELGYLYLLTHPDKPGFIKIGLSYKTQDQSYEDNEWDDWTEHRHRFVEDPVLAEKIIWKLLDKPLPHDREPFEIELSKAEEAMRCLIHQMYHEIALAEKELLEVSWRP